MIAFGGEPAIKAEVLAELTAAIASGVLLPDDDNALHQGISAVAVLAGGATEFDRFEARTGYPAGLGLLLDRSLRNLANDHRDDMRRMTLDWFSAAAPGQDMSLAASRYAGWLLRRTAGLQGADGEAEQTVLDDVRGLHEAEARGEIVARRQWAAVRTAALAAADVSPTHPQRQRNEIAAAMAWPAARSRTILAEGFEAVNGLHAWLAVDRTGWTAERRADCDRVMQALWIATSAEREAHPTTYRFPDHFAAREPGLSAQFVQALMLERSEYAASSLAAAHAAVETLKAGMHVI